MKSKAILVLLAVLMLGCVKDPEDYPKHMLIHEGHYRLDPDSTIQFDFRMDGTGQEMITYSFSTDTVIHLFKWNTSDWSKGTKVIEMVVNKMYSGKKWEDVNYQQRYQIRDVEDSEFWVCMFGFETCYYNEGNPWRRAVKIND